MPGIQTLNLSKTLNPSKALSLSIMLISLSFVHVQARAEQALVAVASNFRAPMQALLDHHTKHQRQRLRASYNSSGKITAQIQQGAPFDIFLSADCEKPDRLAQQGYAKSNDVTVYAVGQLALWAPNIDSSQNSPARTPKDLLSHTLLSKQGLLRIAVANPRLAPYGKATQQALETLNLYSEARTKLVTGENISQAYQFVASGNVELGFVARSQIITEKPHHYWLVPNTLHSPIKQCGVLLKNGSKNTTARDFFSFLMSTTAKAIIESYGYDVQ